MNVMTTPTFNNGTPTSFDDSLRAVALALQSVLGKDHVEQGLFFRDATGILTFATQGSPSDDLLTKLIESLGSEAAHYVRKEKPIWDINHPAITRLTSEGFPINRKVHVSADEELTVRLIDRRIVGADWLSKPEPVWQPPEPGRLVFSSMKGGVGRSTALAVLAADLAYQSRNVLVIDLDLEAPGIGTMLVAEKDRSKFGVLDWMVESNTRELDEDFLSGMVAPSAFGSGRGAIDVVSSVGQMSDRYPENVLAKIGRAYLESSITGESQGFLQKCRELIDRMSQRRRYDAILIDARAGLHETTATPILGLGADVLFFGIDTSQTFSSYRYLFAHLESISRTLVGADAASFVTRMRFVQAKAKREDAALMAFRDRTYELFAEFLYSSPENSAEQSENIVPPFSLNSEDAPHFAWPVYSNSSFAEFDPLARAEGMQLSPQTYEAAYDDFLTAAWERLHLTRNK